MIPVPEKDSVGVEKFVPLTVKVVTVAPCTPVVGETTPDGTGAPDVTVNAADNVAVCASALVTTTFLAVSAAALVIVMFAVMVVALRVPYELTVTPVPLNERVDVPPESNAVPVTVTLPV